MARILDTPIKRRGRSFDPPPGLDEMAELLRNSPSGTQVTNDETYPTQHAAQVKAATYRYWLKKDYDLHATTITGPDPDGGTGFIFGLLVAD